MTNGKPCKVCNRNTGKKIRLICGQCKGYFHLECGNVSEVDARLMQQEKTPWKCEECTRRGTTQRRSTIYDVHNQDSDGIGEVKSILRDLQSEFREMRAAMDFLNEKFEEERKRSKIMSDMFTEISKDNVLLKERVEKLELALNTQQANNIKKNICINGLINNDEKTNAKQKTLKLFSYLDATENDLESIKLLDTKSGIKVVATLVDDTAKERILGARARKGKITRRTVGIGLEDTVIYVSEELTKDLYSLFKSAKKLKDVGYKYIWHRNGKVLVRKQEGDKTIFIKSQNFLNELLAQNPTNI